MMKDQDAPGNGIVGQWWESDDSAESSDRWSVPGIVDS